MSKPCVSLHCEYVITDISSLQGPFNFPDFLFFFYRREATLISLKIQIYLFSGHMSSNVKNGNLF